MDFFITGINHKTAPVDLREQLYLRRTECELLLADLKTDPNIVEALVLSTCNRTEIYAVALNKDNESIQRKLMRIKKISNESFWKSRFYTYGDEEAVRHLLEVSCGLNSLIIGEKQILGQLRTAIDLSRERQMLGRFLNILCNLTLRAGKKARHETQISTGGSSVSWAAVETAKKLLGTLDNKSILILGAGKMSKLAATDFHRKGVGQLFVMNRTKEKGDELAEKFGGTSVGYWELKRILKRVDVCICSVSAPHYLIEKELVEDVMKSRKTDLVLIDISMPRNIHPEIAQVKGANLISLDQLDKIIEYNIQQRQEAVESVNQIIDTKCIEFYKKLNPTVETSPIKETATAVI